MITARCMRIRNGLSSIASRVTCHPRTIAHNHTPQLRWLAFQPSRTLRPKALTPQSRNKDDVLQSVKVNNERPSASPGEEPPGDNPRYRRATLRDVGRSIGLTLVAFLFGHYISTHHYALTLPQGASMLPTFSVSGDCVLISKHYRRGQNVRVGDLIVAIHPMFPDGNAVLKRVVGMPGDFVWVPEHTDVDGYYVDVGEGRGRMIQVPKGHCWLSGDNWAASRDSRHYGAVPLGLVMGKVVWRVWPLSRWGATENIIEDVPEGMGLL